MTLSSPRGTTNITTLVKRFQHNFALTREIPNSFVRSITEYYQKSGGGQSPPSGISIPLARSQHDDYVALLRGKVPTLRLPALEDHPDGVFVEDTVVAVRNRAVLTHPGHASRQGEVETIRSILRQLGLEVMDMRSQDPNALCDGGDVLFTGRHMFVGLSSRTNAPGAGVLERAFHRQIPVLSVPMNPDHALHLKSVITHLDERTLLAPHGAIGDEILQDMKAEELGYTVVRLPDIAACNVVAINGLIVASSSSCPESKQILQHAAQERNLQVAFVGTTEIAKSDGACTCCSVLLSL